MAKEKKNDPSAIVVERQRDETDAQAMASVVLSPSLQSALTIRGYGRSFDNLELMSLVHELRNQIGEVIDGDLGRAEAMLTAQAHALDAIFSNLARRAIGAEYLSSFDTYLKLGLRAQSQCRATWETLAVMKNPVGRAYVNQANFANNQQINNKTDPSRTREKQNSQNELLEKTEHEPDKWLDTGAPTEAVGTDSDLETVGEIDGTENT